MRLFVAFIIAVLFSACGNLKHENNSSLSEETLGYEKSTKVDALIAQLDDRQFKKRMDAIRELRIAFSADPAKRAFYQEAFEKDKLGNLSLQQRKFLTEMFATLNTLEFSELGFILVS